MKPYDRGYRDGWADVRRGNAHKHRDLSDGEYALGYGHGREDGTGREVDWWPDYAKGRAGKVPPDAPSWSAKVTRGHVRGGRTMTAALADALFGTKP